MARRQRSAHFYPKEYFDIIETVALTMGQVTVECETEKVAKSLQGMWYAFTGAMMNSYDRLGNELEKDSLQDGQVRRLAPFAQKVQCYQHAKDSSGLKRWVTYSHRAESWHAKALAQGLKNVSYGADGPRPQAVGAVIPATPPIVLGDDSPEINASLERLKALMKADKPVDPPEPAQESNQPPVMKG